MAIDHFFGVMDIVVYLVEKPGHTRSAKCYFIYVLILVFMFAQPSIPTITCDIAA
jgi:hypothetical protein